MHCEPVFGSEEAVRKCKGGDGAEIMKATSDRQNLARSDASPLGGNLARPHAGTPPPSMTAARMSMQKCVCRLSGNIDSIKTIVLSLKTVFFVGPLERIITTSLN